MSLVLSIFAVLAILQGAATLMDGIRAARHMRHYRPRRRSIDRVMVFCPCKGTDPEFEKNVQSILSQDYPNHSVVFIVESESDPAYRILRALNAHVLVAGRASSR